MQQDNDSLSLPQFDIESASHDEIVKHFEWMDFTDPIGHKLTLNIDFIKLVELALKK